MANQKKINIILMLLALSCCGKSLPELTGINLKAWKDDKNGCNGQRAAIIDTLQQQRNKLQGLSELQIVQLLGRPDQQELYKRHQKFYYYLLEPGKACGTLMNGKRLSVRFNATGASKEIAVE